MGNKPFINYHVEAWDTLQHLFKVKRINDHTLHFAATFFGKLDFIRMKKSVAIAADIFPLIRCRFNQNGAHPCWEEKSDTLDEMVRLIETNDQNEEIMKFLYKEANTTDGPQLKVAIFRATKNDTLCITVNHMLCDAAGFKDLLYLLSSIYTDINKNSTYPPLTAMHDRKIRQLLRTFSIRDKLKIYFSNNNMSIHDSAEFHFEGNLKNPFIEMRTMPREQFCALKAYAKLHNATVNDVMLTALNRVLFHIFGRTITIPCANDLRKYLPSHKADGICNLVTNISCNIGEELGATFDDTLEKVKSTMNKEKADNSCLKSLSLMETLFDRLPYKTAIKILDKGFTNPPIAFTNIGVLDKDKLVFETAEIKSAYMTGSIKYVPYFQLALSTFDNEAAFSINLYGTQSDRNQIAAFLDQFILELQNAK
jgi:NRPS condensation-like uncharacterized protein